MRNNTRFNMDVQSAVFFLKRGDKVEITRHETLPPDPAPCFAMAKHTSEHFRCPFRLCRCVCWSDGSQRCGWPHLHSIQPCPLPWHRRQRPQVGAPPLFPRTSSTQQNLMDEWPVSMSVTWSWLNPSLLTIWVMRHVLSWHLISSPTVNTDDAILMRQETDSMCRMECFSVLFTKFHYFLLILKNV